MREKARDRRKTEKVVRPDQTKDMRERKTPQATIHPGTQATHSPHISVSHDHAVNCLEVGEQENISSRNIVCGT
jgi:hypothetical protein